MCVDISYTNGSVTKSGHFEATAGHSTLLSGHSLEKNVRCLPTPRCQLQAFTDARGKDEVR